MVVFYHALTCWSAISRTADPCTMQHTVLTDLPGAPYLAPICLWLLILPLLSKIVHLKYTFMTLTVDDFQSTDLWHTQGIMFSITRFAQCDAFAKDQQYKQKTTQTQICSWTTPHVVSHKCVMSHCYTTSQAGSSTSLRYSTFVRQSLSTVTLQIPRKLVLLSGWVKTALKNKQSLLIISQNKHHIYKKKKNGK